MRISLNGLGVILVAAVLFIAATASAKDPQRVPKRLSSVGDSITEAINAEEYNIFNLENPNHWASWANGYHGFWEWLFGRTDVDSHNQRITDAFGRRSRRNYMEALSGADSFDLAQQTAQSVGHSADYVTWFMGHNDVCQNSIPEIPDDATFEANSRAGLENLRTGLPNGATVYVVGLVDVYKLWELGDDLDSLGIIPCKWIWATTLLNMFPCGSMVSPANSEADRQYTRSRNIAFNNILQSLVAEYNAADSHHYYVYTNEAFEAQFVPSEVSGFDCFHPSADGQTRLAAESWADGPFAGY